jgi:hypothetical protein
MDIQVNALNRFTELCHIMNKHGSDKTKVGVEHLHTYTQYYYPLFESIRNNPIRVFELGLGTNNVNLPSNMGADGKPGASLHGWREFFPNASIFGADIDRDILFDEARIRTYYCDQGSPKDIEALWSIPELREDFDIIVEDGMHDFSYNVTFFENSIHKVKVGGVYIIEDIDGRFMDKYQEQMNVWMKKYPNFEFRLYNVEYSVRGDNILLIAQRKYT